MHSGKNYDWHFIIWALKRVIDERYADLKVDIIPLNYEKFITIRIKIWRFNVDLVFLDSLNFLLALLEKLAKDLAPTISFSRTNFRPTAKGLY